MRAACLQFDVVAGDVEANLAAVERGLSEARAHGAGLVVLPEMWPTSFLDAGADLVAALAQTEAALSRIARWSAEMSLAVAGSALGPTPGLPANRWHLFQRGTLAAGYDKVHLFGPTAEDEGFSAGDAPPASADVGAARVGGVVCYDLRFPEVARSLFRAGTSVLAVSAQWPVARAAHWRALCIGRAVEAQAFVVACNRTGSAAIGRRRMVLDFPGNSLIVDPEGRVLAEGQGSAELVQADLDLELVRMLRTRVPVARDERRDLYRSW